MRIFSKRYTHIFWIGLVLLKIHCAALEREIRIYLWLSPFALLNVGEVFSAHAAISHQDTGGRRVPAVSGREIERKDCHGANIFRAGLRVIKRGRARALTSEF